MIWEDNTLKIVDSGEGIDEKISANLFKKYYSSKGSKGNGIGLYLSREMIKKWGYDLYYKKENGHTSFQFKKTGEES